MATARTPLGQPTKAAFSTDTTSIRSRGACTRCVLRSGTSAFFLTALCVCLCAHVFLQAQHPDHPKYFEYIGTSVKKSKRRLTPVFYLAMCGDTVADCAGTAASTAVCEKSFYNCGGCVGSQIAVTKTTLASSSGLKVQNASLELTFAKGARKSYRFPRPSKVILQGETWPCTSISSVNLALGKEIRRSSASQCNLRMAQVNDPSEALFFCFFMQRTCNVLYVGDTVCMCARPTDQRAPSRP